MLDRLGNTSAGARAADNWKIERLVAASPIIGSNGMRLSAGGKLYVAQAFGSQISAVTPETGAVEIVSPADGKIIAPDDLAFDSKGNLFVTEVMSARVSAIRPGGKIEVIASDVPVANGVTVHQDRIFMSEFRMDGRIMELFADGSTPRELAGGLVAPNALSMGPDGCLYFPLVPLGEVWRVPATGGTAERVAGDFKIPTAVKFDRNGQLVVVESGTGDITRYDPVTGRRTKIATIPYGIDNLEIAPDGVIYASHFTDGEITRVDTSGHSTVCVRGAMVGPNGMAVTRDGGLIVADGMSIATVSATGRVGRPAMLLQHGFPGYVRNLVENSDGSWTCANSGGDLIRYVPGKSSDPIAKGLDTAMGLIGDGKDGWLVCESGTGRVLGISAKGEREVVADGLDRPTGIARGANGTIYVSEAGAGRLSALVDGKAHSLLGGMIEPHGVAVLGDDVLVLDRGGRKLLAVSAGKRTSTAIASDLPTGGGEGRHINTPPGIALLMPGPLWGLADLAVLPDGRVCVGCDGDGSILTLSKRAAN